MLIIGEKINGAIPSVKEAIFNRNGDLIKKRAIAQAEAGADFLDCAPSTETEVEYETMIWLIHTIQEVTEIPLCIDSPDVMLLKRILEENVVKRPGMVNSVNEEGTKCETIFPLIAGTGWKAVGLTCDREGIPLDSKKKVDIAKTMIDKAGRYGVNLGDLHIDPCVMSLSTVPEAMEDFLYCIEEIHAYAPEVKVTGAVSNISFQMPCRKNINQICLAYAMKAGLDSAILDPCSPEIVNTIYTCDALNLKDRGGRKYNRAYRKGLFVRQK